MIMPFIIYKFPEVTFGLEANRSVKIVSPSKDTVSKNAEPPSVLMSKISAGTS